VGVEFVKCDLMKGKPDKSVFEGVVAVVNLAGASMAGRRWNAEYKKLILESRVWSTRNLVEGMREAGGGMKLVSISGIGFYGDKGEGFVDENSTKGEGFLADVCEKWEEEARKYEVGGGAVSIVRTANVVGDGGFVEELARFARFGVMVYFGDGEQFFPWVEMRDLVEILIEEIESGAGRVRNAVSGEPVRQRELFEKLGKQMGAKIFFGVPRVLAWVVKGELGLEMFKGVRVRRW